MYNGHHIRIGMPSSATLDKEFFADIVVTGGGAQEQVTIQLGIAGSNEEYTIHSRGTIENDELCTFLRLIARNLEGM